MTLPPFVNLVFAGNPLWRWGAALLAALATLGALLLLRHLVRTRLQAVAARTSTAVDDALVHMLGATRRVYLMVASLWAGSQLLTMDAGLRGPLTTAVVVASIVQAGWWGSVVVGWWVRRVVSARSESDPDVAMTVQAGAFVGRLVLWALVLMLALSNLGIDVTALVAGLGVGGIAVALAAQSILGDLFASLTIVLDKPFVVGDFIIVGTEMGTVEKVGLKTTRVRALSGEQLIFSNGDLLSSRVRNLKRMDERRVVFRLGVEYGTPHDKLAAIPSWIREAIEALPDTRFDRCHFAAFGDFSLLFEVVYWVTVPDMNTYMDRQQALNLAIAEIFEREGVVFAYPTQTLHIASLPAKG